MSMDEFADLMHDSVTIRERTGTDRYNKPTWSDPRVVRCMITQRPRIIRDADGEEKVSGTTVHLAEVINIKTDAQITLPDGTTPPILRVDRMPDPEHGGINNEVIYT